MMMRADELLPLELFDAPLPEGDYQALPEVHKDLLIMFALVGFKLSRADARRLWSDSGMEQRLSMKLPDAATVSKLIRELVSDGYLYQPSGQAASIRLPVQTQILRDFFADDPNGKVPELTHEVLHFWHIHLVEAGFYTTQVPLVAFYARDRETLEDYFQKRRYLSKKDVLAEERWLFRTLIAKPYCPEAFDRFIKEFSADGLFSLFTGPVGEMNLEMALQLRLVEHILQLPESKEKRDALAHAVVRVYLAEGHYGLDQLRLLCIAVGDSAQLVATLVGVLSNFSDGNFTDILAQFPRLQKELGKTTFYNSQLAVFQVLSLLALDTDDAKRAALEVCESGITKSGMRGPRASYGYLKDVCNEFRGVSVAQAEAIRKLTAALEHGDSFCRFIGLLSHAWLQVGAEREERLLELRTRLYAFIERGCAIAGLPFLFFQADYVFMKLLEAGSALEDPAEEAEAAPPSPYGFPFVELVTKASRWESALSAIGEWCDELKHPEVASNEENMQYRLQWFFRKQTWYSERELPVDFLYQERGVRGQWKKARAISLKALLEGEQRFALLPEYDRELLQLVKSFVPSYSFSAISDGDYALSTAYPMLVPKLVGHPQVFFDNGETCHKVEVVRREPRLYATEQEDGGVELALVPAFRETDYQWDWFLEGDNRLVLVDFDAQHERLSEILGEKNKLIVPAVARERVLETVKQLASLVLVTGTAGMAADEDYQETKASAAPLVQLSFYDSTLAISVWSAPLGSNGPLFSPGEGHQMVMTEQGGKGVVAYRDLAAERRASQSLITKLIRTECEQVSENQLRAYSLQLALEVLCLMRDEQEQGLVVMWPQGEQLKLQRARRTKDLVLKVQKKALAYAISGGLMLENGETLDLAKIVALTVHSRRRFIELDDGTFLTLSQQMRRQISLLDKLSEKDADDDGGLLVNQHGSSVLKSIEDAGAELDSDEGWQHDSARLREAWQKDFAVPHELKATLRHYQLEGYQWLMRLAHWGVSACLADDMGLGKTIQTMACLLARKDEGPALVVAPTSVCINWEAECARFAPSLNCVTLAGANREALIASLSDGDVLLCSYGLLQRADVMKLLKSLTWGSVILDEAQHIKNSGTKRSKAARELKAKFKVITSGTPIENHLHDLWTLFDFLNPGLLGNQRWFHKAFVQPIEKGGCELTSGALRELLKPFILRRTKEAVLNDLPPLTELVHFIEMSDEEKNLYEAIRLEALQNLQEVVESGAEAKANPVKILAALSRLRQLCCNSQLVMPEMAVPSSKLAAFAELVNDIRESGHRVLVFSQFVGHLQIVKEWCDEEKVSYQYLDGSSSTASRRASISAFQAGEGEVFLISLKAGGSGLNLTAADYVIHLDPWWNPAVEDQATDRAHRIGQKKPVTVYRLVTKGTIEHQIIDLHTEKRQLADSILEGSDAATSLDAEQLLQMLEVGMQ